MKPSHVPPTFASSVRGQREEWPADPDGLIVLVGAGTSSHGRLANPVEGLAAHDERLRGFPLGIQGIEGLVEILFRRLPGVDGAADGGGLGVEG
jgi:hypothetical protein